MTVWIRPAPMRQIANTWIKLNSGPEYLERKEDDMKVIKRSGAEETLTKKKIFDSIVKANDCVTNENKLTQKQIFDYLNIFNLEIYL